MIAPMLRLLASCYAASSATRRFLYRQGLLRSAPLPCPVISIGNLTSGGTGKTPFVEFLARWYCQQARMPTMVLQVRVAEGAVDGGRRGGGGHGGRARTPHRRQQRGGGAEGEALWMQPSRPGKCLSPYITVSGRGPLAPHPPPPLIRPPRSEAAALWMKPRC